MNKAFERALDPCKTEVLRVGSSARPAWLAGKDRMLRIFFWVAVSSGLLGLAFVADGPVSRILTVGSSTFLKNLALCASKAGEGWVVAAFGAAVSLFLFWRRRFEGSRAVFLVSLSGLLTGGAATVIRSLVGRTRPTAHEVQGFYGVWHDSHWIIGQYDFGAFPSGHVATVIGLAAAAWLIDRRLGMLAALYAVLVTWSRIALGCHHFSDTVAAGILGLYGAHLVLARLGPPVVRVSRNLQNTWLARQGRVGPSSD